MSNKEKNEAFECLLGVHGIDIEIHRDKTLIYKTKALFGCDNFKNDVLIIDNDKFTASIGDVIIRYVRNGKNKIEHPILDIEYEDDGVVKFKL